MEFLTTDPEAVAILGVDRGVPSNTVGRSILENDAVTDFTATLEWQGHEIVQACYDHQLTLGTDLYIHPYYEHDLFREIYEAPIERFLNGSATAAEAINSILTNFDDMLASVMGE
jgi:oligogalacturonide transport system substrate-binding protein